METIAQSVIRKVFLLIVFLAFLTKADANSFLEEVAYQGRIFLDDKWLKYSMTVRFEGEENQKIEGFEFLIDGKPVNIPQDEFEKLKQVTRVDFPRVKLGNPEQLRVRIFGGDGAKSYKVDVIIDSGKFLRLE